MEPQPPFLLDATSKWTPAQLFWIAKNGIKMTGMPSWRDSMGDAQIWDVVGFLEAARRLPPRTYAEWRSRAMCGGFKGPGQLQHQLPLLLADRRDRQARLADQLHRRERSARP